MYKRQRLDDGSAGTPFACKVEGGGAEPIELFKEWVTTDGGKWNDLLTIKRTDALGVHVVAAGAIPANAELFVLPARFCMSAAAAREHPAIGKHCTSVTETLAAAAAVIEQADVDRALVYAMLLYETSLGAESFWSPYISILPSLQEFSERVVSILYCIIAGRVHLSSLYATPSCIRTPYLPTGYSCTTTNGRWEEEG